jgi:hypothetical protein
MSDEMPEMSFKEMLVVPEGPPESVWERALDAAFASTEQDAVPDDEPPDSARAGILQDPSVDFLQTDDDAGHHPAHDDSSADSAWEEENGVPLAGHDDGDELPDSGHGFPYGSDGLTDGSDGLTGGGDDAGN